MALNANILKKYRWRILLFLGLSIGYAWLYQNNALVNIQLASKSSATFKVYWAGAGKAYSEKQSSTITIFSGVKHYSLTIGDLDKVDKLRIQPLNKDKRKIRLISLRIRQNGFQKIVYQKTDDLRQFSPVDQIGKTWVDDDGLWVISSGSKPQLDLKLNPQRNPGESKISYAVLALFLIISFLPYHRIPAMAFGYVPYLMLFVGVLIFTMSSLSRYNKHPDEYVHYHAAKYYQHNWVPPAICTPGTEKTYSVYGVSRLNSYETAHFFAGKFSTLWGFLPGDDYRKVRYFNVFLWFLLTVIAFRASQSRIFFVPLLLSPQIWYLFSYCNSDAFALFFLFIFSYLIIDQQSLLKRYLNGQGFNWARLTSGILLGILVAILFLLKLNYYFYIIFLACGGIIAVLIKKSRPSKQQLQNAALIAVVAICVITGRLAWDLHVNGFEKKAKSLACQEKLAKKAYKPSTPLHKKAIVLKLRQRGTSLNVFLSDYHYLPILFRSATSAYGYMEMFAQKGFYRFMLLLLVAFVGIGGFFSFYRTSMDIKLLALTLFACGSLIVAAAAWKSWTSVFQPQGRYIFPILPMIGLWYYTIKEAIPINVFNLVVGLLFLASAYSFIWIGLLSIPKI